MARDVFISYKREERGEVERIAERLRGLGLDVWFDTKLQSGMSFDEEINREVRQAKCVLVCWSPGAMASDWVRAEASIGKGRDVLAAVMLRPTELFPPFNLIHAEDLTDWKGEDLHPGWLNTLARVGTLCERPDIVERARKYGAVSSARDSRGTYARKKGGAAGALIAATLALAAAGAGGFWFFTQQAKPVAECKTQGLSPSALREALSSADPACASAFKAAYEQADNAAFESAKASGKLEEIEAYLAAFPDGAHLQDAQAAIAEWKAKAANDDAFAKLDLKDVNALRLFLEANPSHPDYAKAKLALYELDDAAWAVAKTYDSEKSYTIYLDQFPISGAVPGQHVEEAQARLKMLASKPADPPKPDGVVRPPIRQIDPKVFEKLRTGVALPKAYASGAATLRQTWTFDLDAGTEGGPNPDIWFAADTATQRYLAPRGGAKTSPLFPASPGFEGCKKAPLAAHRTALSAATKGYVCVRTQEGRLAMMRIEEGPGPSPGVLKFSFTVWN